MNQNSLEQLARASHAGDKSAYEELLSRSIAILAVYYRKHSGEAHLVDDLVQDTLLVVHKVFSTYNPCYPFKPWLLTIARRRAIDAYRTNIAAFKRENQLSGEVEVLKNPYLQVDAKIDIDRLESDASLPTTSLIRLLHVEGWSLKEIAADEKSSVGAIKVRIHRAIKAFREYANK